MARLKAPSKMITSPHECTGDETEPPWSGLTDAEWRLVLLAASGWNDREIAKAAGKTPKSVADRFQALLDKLGLADRLTLVLASFATASIAPSHILQKFSPGSNIGGQIAAKRSS